MNTQFNQGVHWILFVLFCIVYFVLVDIFITEDLLKLIAAGLFSTIVVIWGNITKMVLLRIPAGPKSYKIINYTLIALGVVCLAYSTYEYIRSS
jgi:hypothetical protein